MIYCEFYTAYLSISPQNYPEVILKKLSKDRERMKKWRKGHIGSHALDQKIPLVLLLITIKTTIIYVMARSHNTFWIKYQRQLGKVITILIDRRTTHIFYLPSKVEYKWTLFLKRKVEGVGNKSNLLLWILEMTENRQHFLLECLRHHHILLYEYYWLSL